MSERTIARASLPDRGALYASSHGLGATEAVHAHIVAAGVELTGGAYDALSETIRMIIREAFAAGATAPETALELERAIRDRLEAQLLAAGLVPATARRQSEPPA